MTLSYTCLDKLGCAGFWTPQQMGGGVQFSSGNFNMDGQNAETVLVTVNAISGANDTRVR